MGILLNLPIPFVKFFTNPVASGYTFYCGKTASQKRYNLPEWKDYGKLWVNAFIAGIISLIYLIPVIILLFVFAKELIMAYATDNTALTVDLINNPTGLISIYGWSILFIWVLTIITGYFVPIAILNWIITGKFGSAFNFRDIFKKVLNGKYFGAWLLLTIIEMIVGFVILKFFTLDLLKDASSIFMGTNLMKVVLLLSVISVIDFIQDLFAYTVYGNVLEELKK